MVGAEHHGDAHHGCARVRLSAAALICGALLTPTVVLREWLCLRKEMRDIPLVRRVLLTCRAACTAGTEPALARSGVGGQAARPPPPPGRGLAALSAIASTGRNMLAGSLAPGREQPAP